MTAAAGSRRGELVIFAGPSWSGSVREPLAGVDWRGPVIAGDLLRLLSAPPRCVAIIDGLFDQSPAVRHKEILLLRSRGVHVLGAASMGALRAAEMSAFGVVGVGHVYRAYADGRLVGDDEVALLHGPQQFDWKPFTVPLVNVRATLVRALRAHVLPIAACRGMLKLAAGVFYQERTWARLTADTWAYDRGLAPRLPGFIDWLLVGAADIKRLDAAACIDAALRLRHEPEPSPRPEPPNTSFTRALMQSLSVRASSEQGLMHAI